MNWKLIGWIWTAVELLMAATSFGGGCYPQPRHYYRPAYYKAYPQVQVVPTVIAVPVPVPYHANIAEQGKTLYSLGSYISKPLDLTLAVSQLNRSLENSMKVSDGIATGVQAIIETEGGRQARVAEYDAKARLLKAAEPTGHGETTRVQVQAEVGATAPAESTDIATVLQTHCLRCHSGAEPKGQLNLSKYVAFPAEKKRLVLERITTSDAEKRMPPEGSLAVEEIRAFFQN